MKRRGSILLPVVASPPVEKRHVLVRLVSSIVDEFRRDGSYSLYFVLGMYSILIIVTSILVNSYANTEKDADRVASQLYSSSNKFVQYYHGSILFSLSISLPSVVDILMMDVFLQKDITQKGRPVIEYIRRLALVIVAIPNMLIYFRILPANVIDMVQFLQFLSMYYVLMYRLYTLSSAQKVVPFNQLRDVFYSNNCAAYLGFLYKLSLHDLILGRSVFKALFTTCIVVSFFFAIRKVVIWFQFNSRISDVYYKHARRSTRLSFLGLMVALSLNLVLAFLHLLYYMDENVFFPNDFKSYMAISWLNCFIAMVYNAFRNFELMKSEFATKDRLDKNRKMTRSISHEIRTPLNTAFLALELLIGTLRAPFVPDKQEELRTELLEISESIKEGCDISLGILNQLLTFEKLSAGMMQLESKAICVEHLLDSSMKLFKMQAQQVGIVFKLDQTNVDMLKMMVHVDEHKMNQVLRNLLSNAMKFTPKGGEVEIKLIHMNEDNRESTLLENKLEEDVDISMRIAKKSLLVIDHSIRNAGSFLAGQQRFPKGSSIHKSSHDSPTGGDKYQAVPTPQQQQQQRPSQVDTSTNPESAVIASTVKKKAKLLPAIAQAPVHSIVRHMKTHGTLLISVVDSGPGVNKDDQKKLFNEYVQINPGELQKGQGTGLGLSISKAIVQLHGGNIGMTSEGQGKGSTFFIELPCYVDQGFHARDVKNQGKIYPNVSSASPSERVDSGSNLVPEFTVLPSKSEDPTDLAGRTELQQYTDIERGWSAALSPSADDQVAPDSSLSTEMLPPHVEISAFSLKTEGGGAVSSPKDLKNSSSHSIVPNSPVIPTSPQAKHHKGRPSTVLAALQVFKILIVDDSAPNRKMLSRLLTREGHRIFEGDDGAIAVELVRMSLAAQKADEDKDLHPRSGADSVSVDATVNTIDSDTTIVYDFILMDYFMNHMNGPEAARLIREAGYDGPIIGVTGVMGDDSTEFINNGADIVLSKPVTVQSIWKALKSIDFI